MATPLLEILRAGLPDAKISVAGAARYESLLDGLTCFDRYLPIEANERQSTSLMADVFRAAHADTILILPNSWSSVLAARKAGIPRRIGRRAAMRSLFLTDALPAIKHARPMTHIYEEMAAPLLGNAIINIPRPRLVAPATHKTSSLAKPKIAIAPGAAFGVSKQYPPHLTALAIQLACKVFDAEITLLGSSNERDLLIETANALQQININSKTLTGTLTQAKAALARADVLLTMDSGARHMAAALGTPQVVIYGPTHPAWSAHSLDDTTILRVDNLDCLTCHNKRCPKLHHACMQDLDPAIVAEALIARLK